MCTKLRKPTLKSKKEYDAYEMEMVNRIKRCDKILLVAI